MANTLKQLDQLAKAVPAAATQASGTAQLQLQQQLGSLSSKAPITETAQALAAQQQAQATQMEMQGQAQVVQQQQQIAQQQLGTQAAAQETTLKDKALQQQKALHEQEIKLNYELLNENIEAKRSMTKQEQRTADRVQRLGIDTDYKVSMLDMNQRQILANLGGDIKTQIFDKRVEFERDELGRKFRNDIQLMDWTIANVQNNQEFDERMSYMQHMYDQKSQILTTAYNVLVTEKQNIFKQEQNDLNIKHGIELTKLVSALKQQITDDENKKKNARAAIVAGGTVVGIIVGGVVGTYVAPGVGTAGGATLGATTGAAAGSLVAAKSEDWGWL